MNEPTKEKTYFEEIGGMEVQAMKDAEENSKQINEEKICDIEERQKREKHEVIEKSFYELFPSLEGKNYDLVGLGAIDDPYEEERFTETTIQEHTRDNQRIREAIKCVGEKHCYCDKLLKEHVDGTCEACKLLDDIRKELGLDNHGEN